MKQAFALLLALILIFSLTACGGAEQPEAPTPPVQETPAEPEAPEAPQPEEDAPEAPAEPESPLPEAVWDGDYAAATFADIRKYGFGSTSWDGSLPLTETGEVLEIGLRKSSSVTDYDQNPLTLWLEEKTGVTLSFRLFEGSAYDVANQLVLLLAGGGDMPDILSTEAMGSDLREACVEEGYFQNLAGYFITDAHYFTRALENAWENDPYRQVQLENSFYQNAVELTTGQVYGPVTVYDDPAAAVGQEALINTQWLKTLGLKAPATVNELYDVLVAFRDRDPNGNGEKDEIPMMGLRDAAGRGVENYLMSPFIPYTTNSKAAVENGRCYSIWSTDAYRDVLRFIKRLVDEDLLSEKAFTATDADLRRMINPDPGTPCTVGIVCARIGEDFEEGSGSIYSYAPLPVLTDCTGHGGYAFFAPPEVTSLWSVTWDCTNVRLAFRFLDFLYSPEACLRQRWGEEGVDWDWIQNTPNRDLAEENGIYSGDAAYVLYNPGDRKDSRWFVPGCYYADEEALQRFADPADEFAAQVSAKISRNLLQQRAAGAHSEALLGFARTAEEDEAFRRGDSELTSLVHRAKDEFCMGIRNPDSDADWANYLAELAALDMEGTWVKPGQASYDRQTARLEALFGEFG